MAKTKLVPIVAGLALSAVAWAQDAKIDAAKQFFAEFITLENAYDPSLADLYTDDALIKNRRNYPMGGARDTIMPAPKYKALLRQDMPMAKARGDRSTYSNVTYTAEGELIRIQAVRFSELKKYTSPVSLLVGRSPSGKWLVYQELSESRP